MNSTYGQIRRTLLRVGIHLMHLLLALLGDDFVGKGIRRSVLRGFGATIGPKTSFHGGTYFSLPSRLVVGERCFVNRGCYLDLEGSVTLGDDVVIGHGTTLVTTNHDVGPSSRRAGRAQGEPIVIGRGAWLGANVTVLPGVTIGPGAVVGACSVVTRDVPPDVSVAGVPARIIRSLCSGVEDRTVGGEVSEQPAIDLSVHALSTGD